MQYFIVFLLPVENGYCTMEFVIPGLLTVDKVKPKANHTHTRVTQVYGFMAPWKEKIC